MNNSEPTPALFFEGQQPMPAANRLLGLIPEAYIMDDPHLGQHIRELAGEARASVMLLMLVEKEEDALHIRHRLETLASIVRSARTPSEFTLDFGTNWHRAVQSAWQEGDLIVCPVEHTIKTGLFHRTRVLCQVLVEDLHKSVYAISF